MIIESVHNKKVKEWVKLTEKKYRDLTGLYLIEGDHLLNEALKEELVVEIITLNSNLFTVPTYIVNEQIMKKISKQVTPPKVMAVVKKRDEQDIKGPMLILDKIQDPGNLGTIIRSCVAFSMPNLVLSDDTVDLYNPKVIRSTEGMIFHLNIVRRNLDEFLKTIKDQYYIIGTDVNNGVSIKDINPRKDYALIIGNEGKGMGLSKKYCDAFTYIKMDDNCESLNASVSASILLYEMRNKNE